MKIFLLFLALLNSAILVDDIHAIYLSTMKLEVTEKKSILTIKVFEDDLRDALRNYHGHIIDTASTSFSSEIALYFNHHIKINDQSNYKIVEVELVGESYVVNMVDDSILQGSITIEADYFMELFPTQQNILHIFKNGKQTYHIFKKGKEKLLLKN